MIFHSLPFMANQDSQDYMFGAEKIKKLKLKSQMVAYFSNQEGLSNILQEDMSMQDFMKSSIQKQPKMLMKKLLKREDLIGGFLRQCSPNSKTTPTAHLLKSFLDYMTQKK